jgi:RND superfamily putative drug exporter
VIAVWIGILFLAFPFAGKLGDVTRDDRVDYLPAGADSTEVARLEAHLPGGGTIDLIAVYHRDGGLRPTDTRAAAEHARAVATEYGLDRTPRQVLSKDRQTVMFAAALPGLHGEEAQTKAVAEVRKLLGEHPKGLETGLGGSGAVQADAGEIFESIDGTLMMATAAVVAVLLIVTYRSPVLWLVPLLVVGAAVLASMAVVYGLVQAFDLTVSTQSRSIMTVLIFGAGTDYALLITARYREELRRRERPAEAMAAALRGCGPAVLASSGTVAAGLLCLLAAGMNSSSGLGPVGAVGVVCALAAMMTLLPAVLVLLGRRVFWPLIPALGSEPRSRSLFRSMGETVRRRPRAVLAGGLVLLAALATGILNLPGDLREGDSFTDKPDSVRVMESLAKDYPGHGAQPITVLAEDPDVLSKIRTTDGVAQAVPGRTGAPGSRAAGWTEISVYATAKPDSAGEQRTILALRQTLDDAPPAERALVGGAAAQQLDAERTNSEDLKLVVPLVIGAVLLILLALLRSLVAAALLMAAVVATWAAALGLGGLLFEPVFGFPGIDPALPLLSFTFLVALGVDYGIFLMHRMREEALGGSDTTEATMTALRQTGGVIASAGLVLAATFTVLTNLPLVMMVEMGFVVAVGVLLDTFLVRTLVVPALAVLLGRRVWWPGALSKKMGR